MGVWKMKDQHAYTIPNYHPTKMDVLPKTFFQIVLAANWLVQHSRTYPQPTATTFAFAALSIEVVAVPSLSIYILSYCIVYTVY